MELTPRQRSELRGKAHALHPVATVGQQGLTPAVLREIDIALKAHGLIKVRVFSEDRAEREALLAQIATALDAAPVQHLGKLLIIWRPAEEDQPRPAKVEPRSRPSSGKSAPNPRRRRRAT